MIGVFRDQYLRHGRLGRNATFDQARRRGRLDDDLLARSTGIFGPADDQFPELYRHDVEPLGTVLLDRMQLAAAAWGRTRVKSSTATRTATVLGIHFNVSLRMGVIFMFPPIPIAGKCRRIVSAT